jgi:glycine hydroxymethyltransferase
MAQQRLIDLETGAPRHPSDVVAAVHTANRDHRLRVDDGLMLYAGTNVLSPAVEAAQDEALSTRPAQGWPGEKEQTGVEEIERLEVLAADQVARALRGHHAEVRFLSATMANLAVYTAFTRPGDTIAVLSPEAGGHTSHQSVDGTAGIRGLTVEFLPYSPRNFDVDAALVKAFVQHMRPKVILVGGSVALFPHNLAPLREAADLVDALLVYDASHTAGLIAAGLFQDPLAEGADVVTFSTYKTLGGPPGGAAVSLSSAHAERLAVAAYPVLLSNYDPSRLGPLAVAASEAVAQEPAWAEATVACAVRLAERLHDVGLPVVGRERGFTHSHQVVLDASRLGGGRCSMRRLATMGLHAGSCRLPWQQPDDPPEGLRFGTQELVRRGGGIHHIPQLVELIERGLTGTDAELAALLSDTRQVREQLTHDLWGRPTPAPVPCLSSTPPT